MKYPSKTMVGSLYIQDLSCEYRGDISSWEKDDYECESKVLKNNKIRIKLVKKKVEPEDLLNEFENLKELFLDITYWIKYNNDNINISCSTKIFYKYENDKYKISNIKEVKNIIASIKNPSALTTGNISLALTVSGGFSAIVSRDIPKNVPRLISGYRKMLDEYFHLKELQQINYDSRDDIFRKGYILLKNIDTGFFDGLGKPLKIPLFDEELNKLTAIRNILSHQRATQKETIDRIRGEPGITILTDSHGKEYFEFDRNSIDHMNLVGRQESVLLKRIRIKDKFFLNE